MEILKETASDDTFINYKELKLMSPGENTLVFKVDGMSCQHCKLNIEKAVMALEGITSASADLEKNEVEVSFDSGKVQKDELVAAISQAGYRVTE